MQYYKYPEGSKFKLIVDLSLLYDNCDFSQGNIITLLNHDLNDQESLAFYYNDPDTWEFIPCEFIIPYNKIVI